MILMLRVLASFIDLLIAAGEKRLPESFLKLNRKE